MDRSAMPEQCRLHMPAKTSTKEPKGATLSNTCLNVVDEKVTYGSYFHLESVTELKSIRKSVTLLSSIIDDIV